jgi:hypothetical protein
MRIEVAIAGSEDEAASQLKWVLSQLVLAMTARASAFAGCGVIAAEEVKQIGAAQSGSTICLAFLINEQRKRDAGFFPEEPGVVPIAEADGRDADSSAIQLGLVFAQLRDVLSAEDSAIVPEKGHDRRRFSPDRSKHHLISIGIRQTDACQPCA